VVHQLIESTAWIFAFIAGLYPKVESDLQCENRPPTPRSTRTYQLRPCQSRRSSHALPMICTMARGKSRENCALFYFFVLSALFPRNRHHRHHTERRGDTCALVDIAVCISYHWIHRESLLMDKLEPVPYLTSSD
jgi:hypothetical protein